MKFKTTLKGRLDAEINSVHDQWDQDKKDEPKIRTIDGAGKLGDSYEIKAPWFRPEEDDQTTKAP